MKISDILAPLEEFAPLRLQEHYDNCGLQVGNPDAECTGALLTLDVTEQQVDEAVAKGLNLIVSHHPILFRGLKHITGRSVAERVVAAAIKNDIAIYALHTAIDSAHGGVSWEMARRLELRNIAVLSPSDATSVCPDCGLGVVGNLPSPLPAREFVDRVKEAFNAPVARCNRLPESPVDRVALCGGAGSDLARAAIAAKADALVTADCSYHLFGDLAGSIFLVDIGHFESEAPVKDIFYRIIKENFPTFAVQYSETEKNPITYL